MTNVILILLLLVGPFWLLKRAGVHQNLRGRIGLAMVFAFTGIGHFVRTAGMAQMLPPWVPLREAVIYATGVFEFVAAIGLLVPVLSRLAGVLLCVFLVAAFPANIYAAWMRVDFGGHGAGLAYLLIRAPLQLLLLGWTYWFAVRPHTRRNSSG